MLARIFPLGLARGDSFCNREVERKRLKSNINSGRHTLISSPRRYGKSSLVLYTLTELKIPYTKIDLFVTVDETKIEQEILNAVKNIFNQIASLQSQIIDTLKNYIKKLQLKLIIGTDGVNLEIIPMASSSDPAINIRAALLLLEQYLTHKKQKAVLFIDEFQEISIIAQNKGIEGSIRSVAQETEYLNFIFSGSNRHLLEQMFNDKNRPLYKLCERINLERIQREAYYSYLQKMAYATWKFSLSDEVINEILSLVELHPYYLNMLCGKIWQDFTQSPPQDRKEIVNLWLSCLEDERPEIIKDLSFLSELQKKIVISIALGYQSNLSGKKMQKQLNVTSAAIVKALRLLEEKDYIYQFKKGYFTLVDPLIKASINLDYQK